MSQRPAMMLLLAIGPIAATGAFLGPIGCSSNDDGGAQVPDAGPDGLILQPPPAPCDLSKDFGPPTLVPGLPTGSAKASGGALTADELTIVYDDGKDIVIATRNDRASRFETKPWLGAINTTSPEYLPWISNDGKELLFVSNRNQTVFDLYRARREDQGAFSAAQNVLHLTSGSVTFPYVWEGRDLWFTPDNNDGKQAIFRAAITGEATFGPASPVAELNAPSSKNTCLTMTPDGRTAYFCSTRVGSEGFDIWTATRTSDSATFATPTRVANVNTASTDTPSWVSPDGCRLYLSSNRPDGNEPSDGGPGESHIFVAQRPQ